MVSASILNIFAEKENTMSRDIQREIMLREELHEKNLLRRNITAICVISVIFIVAPILLDMIEFASILDFLEHVALAIINAVLYFFVNAIAFHFVLEPSFEETYRIRQLKIEQEKGQA